ncbi:DUF7512 family protein [Halorubrum sp. DTA98]|uniref:DUF7512 family protein n=1 Tax=Halorubrum sp. DTA98 TaxID=3402163 RepID=UPI003AAE1C00
MTGTTLFSGLSPSVHAVALIAVVLVEAALLYVGYGLLEDAVAPTVFERLRQT